MLDYLLTESDSYEDLFGSQQRNMYKDKTLPELQKSYSSLFCHLRLGSRGTRPPGIWHRQS